MSAFTPDRLREVEFNLLVAEQLHDAVPCDSMRPCGAIAVWAATCPSCSALVAMNCDACRAGQDRYSAQNRCRHSGPNGCGVLLPSPLPWVAL